MVPFWKASPIAVRRKPRSVMLGLGLWHTVPFIQLMNINPINYSLVHVFRSFRRRFFWWSPIFDIFTTLPAGLKLLSFLAQKPGFKAAACRDSRILKIGDHKKVRRAKLLI